MKAILAERLQVIAAEASALQGEVDPTLLLDLELIIEALADAVETALPERPTAPQPWPQP